MEYGEERCDDGDLARDADVDVDHDDGADDAAAAARSSRQDAVFRRENRLGEIMMARCYMLILVLIENKIIMILRILWYHRER